MSGNTHRFAWAEIDLGAYRRNIARLASSAHGETWAVVKADAYGHGAVECARAALEAGATGLCVALVGEGEELRLTGIAAPILVMSEQPPDQLEDLVRLGLTATVYNAGSIDALARVASRVGVMTKVHLKVDTGMHRVGAAPTDAVARARSIAAHEWLDLEGVYTHLATADMPDRDADSQRQVTTMVEVTRDLRAAGFAPRHVHIGNSAATLRRLGDASVNTMHRVGIATYGALEVVGVSADLEPVLSLKARVSHVQTLEAGEGVSYGLRRPLARRATVATIPIGYADGVRRGWGEHGSVLIGGRRRPFAGVVTMDQVMVDCGEDTVRLADEAVLIGSQGNESISASAWAGALGTISYEVLTGISPRVPRRYPR
ncbi:MAG: alanine racemase [Ilumatobacteraceae bacterium]